MSVEQIKHAFRGINSIGLVFCLHLHKTVDMLCCGFFLVLLAARLGALVNEGAIAGVIVMVAVLSIMRL